MTKTFHIPIQWSGWSYLKCSRDGLEFQLLTISRSAAHPILKTKAAMIGKLWYCWRLEGMELAFCKLVSENTRIESFYMMPEVFPHNTHLKGINDVVSSQPHVFRVYTCIIDTPVYCKGGEKFNCHCSEPLWPRYLPESHRFQWCWYPQHLHWKVCSLLVNNSVLLSITRLLKL